MHQAVAPAGKHSEQLEEHLGAGGDLIIFSLMLKTKLKDTLLKLGRCIPAGYARW